MMSKHSCPLHHLALLAYIYYTQPYSLLELLGMDSSGLRTCLTDSYITNSFMLSSRTLFTFSPHIFIFSTIIVARFCLTSYQMSLRVRIEDLTMHRRYLRTLCSLTRTHVTVPGACPCLPTRRSRARTGPKSATGLPAMHTLPTTSTSRLYSR